MRCQPLIFAVSLCDVQLRTYNSRLTIDLGGTFLICLGDFSDQLPPSSPSQRASATVSRAPSSLEDLVTILVAFPKSLSSARVLACGSSVVPEPSLHPIRESAQSKLGRGETKTFLCTAGANQQVNNIPRNARCCRTVDNDRRPYAQVLPPAACFQFFRACVFWDLSQTTQTASLTLLQRPATYSTTALLRP